MTEKDTKNDDNDDEDEDDDREDVKGGVVVPLVQQLLLHQAIPVRALVVDLCLHIPGLFCVLQ